MKGGIVMASASTKPLLDVSGLTVGYGHQRVLRGIDFDVAPGEIVGLIGETGSGKTTLCRAILGLVAPQAGTVSFDGVELTGLSTRRLRRFHREGGIRYVYQDPLAGLDPDWAVGDSVIEPLVLGVRTEEQEDPRARAAAVFDDVGLDPALMSRRPAELSGGQRQRVVLARALITRPRLLLCDEPVSALDAGNRILVLELFERLRHRHGVSIVFVSHDLGSIAGISDRLTVLHDGVIVENAPSVEVITNPVSAYARKLIADIPTLPEGAL